MQTFLPYADLQKSVECLDYRRLGKQRVEAMQILKALNRGSGGWSNHPATKMWRGFETALMKYHDEACLEFDHRGYTNNMKLYIPDSKLVILPPWFGNEAFHSAHRAALLAKDFSWYSQFGWVEEPRIEYVWPSAA